MTVIGGGNEGIWNRFMFLERKTHLGSNQDKLAQYKMLDKEMEEPKEEWNNRLARYVILRR